MKKWFGRADADLYWRFFDSSSAKAMMTPSSYGSENFVFSDVSYLVLSVHLPASDAEFDMDEFVKCLFSVAFHCPNGLSGAAEVYEVDPAAANSLQFDDADLMGGIATLPLSESSLNQSGGYRLLIDALGSGVCRYSRGQPFSFAVAVRMPQVAGYYVFTELLSFQNQAFKPDCLVGFVRREYFSRFCAPHVSSLGRGGAVAVDLPSGRFSYSLPIGGLLYGCRGFELSFGCYGKRNPSQQEIQSGSLSYWADNLDYSLSLDLEDGVCLVSPSGDILLAEPASLSDVESAVGASVDPLLAGFDLFLSEDSLSYFANRGSTIAQVMKSGERREYSPRGPGSYSLSEVVWGLGESMTISRDQQGRISSVASAQGNLISINYSSSASVNSANVSRTRRVGSADEDAGSVVLAFSQDWSSITGAQFLNPGRQSACFSVSIAYDGGYIQSVSCSDRAAVSFLTSGQGLVSSLYVGKEQNPADREEIHFARLNNVCRVSSSAGEGAIYVYDRYGALVSELTDGGALSSRAIPRADLQSAAPVAGATLGLVWPFVPPRSYKEGLDSGVWSRGGSNYTVSASYDSLCGGRSLSVALGNNWLFESSAQLSGTFPVFPGRSYSALLFAKSLPGPQGHWSERKLTATVTYSVQGSDGPVEESHSYSADIAGADDKWEFASIGPISVPDSAISPSIVISLRFSGRSMSALLDGIAILPDGEPAPVGDALLPNGDFRDGLSGWSSTSASFSASFASPFAPPFLRCGTVRFPGGAAAGSVSCHLEAFLPKGEALSLACCASLLKLDSDRVFACAALHYADGTTEAVRLPLSDNFGAFQTQAAGFVLPKVATSVDASFECRSQYPCELALLQIYRSRASDSAVPEWDARGAVTGLAWPDGSRRMIIRDPQGMPAAFYDSTGELCLLGRDSSGRAVSAALSSGGWSSLSYEGPLPSSEAAGFLSGQVFSRAFSYSSGRLAGVNTNGVQSAYGYSGEYLVSASSPSIARSYDYDSEGRGSSSSVAGGPSFRWSYGQEGDCSEIDDSSAGHSQALTFAYDAGRRPSSVSSGGFPIFGFTYYSPSDGPVAGLPKELRCGQLQSDRYRYEYGSDRALRRAYLGSQPLLQRAPSSEGGTYFERDYAANQRRVNLFGEGALIESTASVGSDGSSTLALSASGASPSAVMDAFGGRTVVSSDPPTSLPMDHPGAYFNRVLKYLGDDGLTYKQDFTFRFGGVPSSVAPSGLTPTPYGPHLGGFPFIANGSRAMYYVSTLNSSRASDDVFGADFDYQQWASGLSSRRTFLAWIRPSGLPTGLRHVMGFSRSGFGHGFGEVFVDQTGYVTAYYGDEEIALGELRAGEWNMVALTYYRTGDGIVTVRAALNGRRTQRDQVPAFYSLADAACFVVGDFASSLTDPDPYSQSSPNFQFSLAFLSVGCAELSDPDLASIYWEGDAVLNRSECSARSCVSALPSKDFSLSLLRHPFVSSAGEVPRSTPVPSGYVAERPIPHVSDIFGSDPTGLPAFSFAPPSSRCYAGQTGGFLAYKPQFGSSYTVAVWFKPLGASDGVLLRMSNGASTVNIQIQDGSLLAAGTAIASASGLIGSWHLLTFSTDGQSASAWLDSARYSLTSLFGFPTGEVEISIGSARGSSPFDGMLRGLFLAARGCYQSEVSSLVSSRFGEVIREERDPFGRLASVSCSIGQAELRSATAYQSGPNGTLSDLPSESSLFDGSRVLYEYSPTRKLKRRTFKSQSGVVTRVEEYGYDQAGRIIEYKLNGSLADSYSYDASGRNNIVSKGGLAYSYDQTGKDRLASLSDGTSVTYGAWGSGAVAGVFGAGRVGQISWQADRITSAGGWSFQYDSTGARIKRSRQTESYEYLVSGGRLLALSISTPGPSGVLTFRYSPSGSPIGFRFGGAEYFYLADAFGVIHGIADANGVKGVSYAYDPWGKPSISWSSGRSWQDIAAMNPFLFKGYIYDEELGWYYLQSRYYDPSLGRFLSPDSLMPEIGSAEDVNLYAYCRNDPVMYEDPTGRAPEWVYWVVGGLAIVGSAVLTIATEGAAAPLLIGSIIGGASGFTFGGLELTSDGPSWNWESSAKGFGWGAAAGAIGGAAGMGISSMATSFGLSGFSNVTFQFFLNGVAGFGLSAIQANLEGEEFSFARAAVAFGFGGLGIISGNSFLNSIAFAIGFSIAEGFTDEVLDYYRLAFPVFRWWSLD